RFEVPCKEDPAACDKLIRTLRARSGVTLIVTISRQEPPPALSDAHPFTVRHLDRHSARELFVRIAGADFEHDARVDALLETLGGLPIAIELMAHAVRRSGDLSSAMEAASTFSGTSDDPAALAIESSFEHALKTSDLSTHAWG